MVLQARRHSAQHMHFIIHIALREYLLRREVPKQPSVLCLHRLSSQTASLDINQLHVDGVPQSDPMFKEEGTEIHSAVKDDFEDERRFEDIKESPEARTVRGKSKYVDEDCV